MLKLAESHVLSLKPYIPGRKFSKNTDALDWVVLSSNENCLGPSPKALIAANEALKYAHLYPNNHRSYVIDALCKHFRDYDIRPSQVAIGNGTSEMIVNLVRGLVGVNEAVLYSLPSFVMYRLAAQAHGKEEVAVPSDDMMRHDLKAMINEVKNKKSSKVKLIFLSNPNNPTGSYLTHDELSFFISEIPPDVVLVIDEAYFEYVVKKDYAQGIIYALKRPRTIILRTFSKIYGLAGLRMGYAIGDEKIIDIIGRINDPFNVNVVAQHASIKALDDSEHVQKSIEHNLNYLPVLTEGLKRYGFFVYDSVGNFVMAKASSLMPSHKELCSLLYQEGVLVRSLDEFGIKDHIRVSVGGKEELVKLFNVLSKII